MRDPIVNFVNADSRNLEGQPSGWYHTAITSPPYYGLRVYGEDGREIGNEQTPEEYVTQIVLVARQVRRVLRDDGTFWLNLGDTHAGERRANSTPVQSDSSARHGRRNIGAQNRVSRKLAGNLKNKDLIGIPWMVAFALRADGWYLRQEIIWAKAISFGERHARNIRDAVLRMAIRQGLSRARAEIVADMVEPQIGACMPGSVNDRCTSSHEQLFLCSKSPDYFYDIEAVKEKGRDWGDRDRRTWKMQTGGTGKQPHAGSKDGDFSQKGRNLRTVWTVATEPQYGSEHFAAYPTRLVKPCIEAGTSAKGCCPVCGAAAVRIVDKTRLTRARGNGLTKRRGKKGTGKYCSNHVDGVASRTIGWRAGCDCQGIYPEGLQPCRVIDPFGGTGTTAIACNDLGRDCTIVDLLPKYLDEARNRLALHREKRAATLAGLIVVRLDPAQLDLFGDDEPPPNAEPMPEEKPLQMEMFGESSNGDESKKEIKPSDINSASVGPAPVVADA